MLRLAVVILAFIGLGACTGAPHTYGEVVRSIYNPTEFGRGAGRRDLWTQFRGDPFDLGDEAFQAEMIEILRRHQPRPQPTNYTTEPGESADTDFRVVFIFDPPRGFVTNELCRLPLKLAKGEGGPQPLHVAAAFCRSEGVMTSVRGRLDATTGVDDPAFDALIDQLVYDLFPNFNPNRDDDDGCLIPIRCR